MRMLLLLIAGVLIYSGWQNGPAPAPVPEPAPVVAPSAELQQAVKLVGELVRGRPQAPQLAAFYAAAAEVISRDSETVTSTQQVADWLTDASTLQIQGTDLAGSIPGLAAAHYTAVASQIGTEPTALDDAKRQKLVAVLRALAWACGGST